MDADPTVPVRGCGDEFATVRGSTSLPQPHEWEWGMNPIHLYDGNGNWVRTIYPGTSLQLIPGGNHTDGSAGKRSAPTTAPMQELDGGGGQLRPGYTDHPSGTYVAGPLGEAMRQTYQPSEQES